jgi:hypothetical protein
MVARTNTARELPKSKQNGYRYSNDPFNVSCARTLVFRDKVDPYGPTQPTWDGAVGGLSVFEIMVQVSRVEWR